MRLHFLISVHLSILGFWIRIPWFLPPELGIYFGQPRGFKTGENGEEIGFNTEVYAAQEVIYLFLIPLPCEFAYRLSTTFYSIRHALIFHHKIINNIEISIPRIQNFHFDLQIHSSKWSFTPACKSNTFLEIKITCLICFYYL